MGDDLCREEMPSTTPALRCLLNQTVTRAPENIFNIKASPPLCTCLHLFLFLKPALAHQKSHGLLNKYDVNDDLVCDANMQFVWPVCGLGRWVVVD